MRVVGHRLRRSPAADVVRRGAVQPARGDLSPPARPAGGRARRRRGRRRSPASTRSASRQRDDRGPRVERTSLPSTQGVDQLDRGLGVMVVEELPVRPSSPARSRRRPWHSMRSRLNCARPADLVVPDADALLTALRPRRRRAARTACSCRPRRGVAGRAALVHRVEGRDPADLRRLSEGLRARGDARGRDMALDGLDQMQHRQQRGARLRIPGRDLRSASLSSSPAQSPRSASAHLEPSSRSSSLGSVGLIGPPLPSPGRSTRSPRSRRRPCRPRSSTPSPAGCEGRVAVVHAGTDGCRRRRPTCAPSSPRGDSIGT